MPGLSFSLLEALLGSVPLWLVGILLVAACLIAREAGVLLHRRWAHEDAQKPEADGYIIGAIFGLLAFVSAITLSIAIERYDARRSLVAEEANAISAAYQSASLLNEPERRNLQGLIRQYAHLRIAPQGRWNDAMEAQQDKAQALRTQIWDATQAAAFPVRDTDLAPYLMAAVTDALNVGVLREVAGRAHIPTRILDVMLLYLLTSSLVLGYVLGTDRGTRRRSSTLLLVLLAIALVLILDIDWPQSGTIEVPQRALEEAASGLDRDAVRQGQSPPAQQPVAR